MDSFSSPAKDAYRKDVLRFLRSHGRYALFNEGSLIGKWVELVGASGHLTLEMLVRESVIQTQQFVGVDSDKTHIERHRTSHPDAKWVCGRLEKVAIGLDDVAVLNIDGYTAAGSRLSSSLLGSIQGLARRSMKRFGAFGLVFNMAWLHDGFGVKDPVREGVRHLCEVISSWRFCAPVDPALILPNELPEMPRRGEGVDLSEYVYAYKGDDRSRPMMNLKLVLR